MKKNIGSIDRWIRIIFGILIGILGLVYQSWWGLLSVVLIFTAIINFCPIWWVFKWSTAKKEA